ncbi:MAG TPA: FtsK/SpoIIIE domain-containing protein [Pseudonocardia sp.]|jgi:S-DNA-T family DNA segregation ATPase FtsK/SpoIIIE|nr:FtsK/SpoIIIE domain-containing protein [Pseudonocardia sp.]
MTSHAVMTTPMVLVLIALGAGVIGWLLHRAAPVLKELLETLAVLAAVFFALRAVIKGVLWVMRTLVPCWRSALTGFTVWVWCRYLGWPSLAATASTLVVGLVGWWLYARCTGRLPQFDALVGRRIRGWWLRWWFYGTRMPQWLRACRLTVPDRTVGIQVFVSLLGASGNPHPPRPRPDLTPRIVGVRSGSSWDEVLLRLVPGQKPEDFDASTRELAVARRVSRCQVRELAPDVVSVDFQRRNLLSGIVRCRALTELADVSGSSIDLDRVWAGRTEYGTDWRVSLRGSHTLVAGATGAGKGSVLWAPIHSIAPAIRDGLVRVSGVDPKGMELAYGRRLFHRYAVTSKDALALLDDLIEGMEARKSAHAGQVRTVPVTRDTPLELLEFDEVGALTKYVGDRKTRDAITDRLALLTTQGRALGYTVRGYVQEPTKDTVPVRDLFPRRICLRVSTKSHVGMALGDQAYDRGAWANRIGESEAGVGYLFGEGVREPLRVRAGWVPDTEIKALETFVTRPAPHGPLGDVHQLRGKDAKLRDGAA